MLRSAPQADPGASLRAAVAGWSQETRAVLARIDEVVAAQEAAVLAGADPALAAAALDSLMLRLEAVLPVLPSLAP